MYSSTVYYWARLTSNTILQLFYPISSVLVIFYGLGISEKLQNLLMFILYAVVLNICMVCQGYFCGALCETDSTANQVNSMMMIIFMLCSGGLGNVTSFPAFISYFSYISPQRYGCQGLFLRLVKHIEPQSL